MTGLPACNCQLAFMQSVLNAAARLHTDPGNLTTYVRHAAAVRPLTYCGCEYRNESITLRLAVLAYRCQNGLAGYICMYVTCQFIKRRTRQAYRFKAAEQNNKEM